MPNAIEILYNISSPQLLVPALALHTRVQKAASNSADIFFDALEYHSDTMIEASPMKNSLLARQYQNMHDDRLKQDEEYVFPVGENNRRWPPLYKSQADVLFDFFLGFLEGPLASWKEELSVIKTTELYHLSSLMFKFYDPVRETYIPSYEMIQE
ncbi:uncharacterized protein BKA55DRAFT_547477 [Fusarium redolens]|uniref:Uncharacterized protein n=1 Tax=Fusarium redolens TaxID=48865 RepID=A0A9P9JNT7_FUSRE|nr:uncharacterized protein BKA55DRAFT_547477 [Fusarium redolens]KAH7202698.1 hypothetical protein BKA55DRAFT_547477 [Fusarium redolens]